MNIKQYFPFFISIFFILICISCRHSQNKLDEYRVIPFIAENGDTVTIPESTDNFNRFIKDSLDLHTIPDALYAMLQYHPLETFKYPFEYSENRAELKIIETPDHMIRAYSLFLPYQNSTTFIQYKVNDTIKLIKYPSLHNPPVPENNGAIINITQLIGSDDKKRYLIDYISDTGMPREIPHTLTLCRINDGILKSYPGFHSCRDTLTDIHIYLETYHSDEWINADRMFSYDNPSKKLYIPLLNEDNVFDGRYLIYKFDGKIFNYAGVE